MRKGFRKASVRTSSGKHKAEPTQRDPFTKEKESRCMPEWKISDDLSPQAYFQYAIGGKKHPQTQLWQIWITFDGKNINWVAAYHCEDWVEQGRLVQQAKDMTQRLIPTGEKWDRQKAFALLNTLYADSEDEPRTMPPYIEAMIRINFTWR
jgi:hypothetical protein